MKHRIFGIGAALLVMLVGMYGFAAYAKPLPAITGQVTTPKLAAATKPSLVWPASGQAAIGASSFGILATHGVQKASPTASTAKIMTALMVLKAKPLVLGQQGPTITISRADVNLYNAYVAQGGSVARVALGEKISEYQALQAMLLPSADNMADTLAIWAYGSIAGYSAAANAYAASLGMAHTYFGAADASGLAPSTTSTAHDLVLLGLTALKNPVLAKIVNQPAATVPVAGTIRNVNFLLGRHGITGIKTGNSNQAGGVYLFSARQTFPGGRSITIVGAVIQPAGTLYSAMLTALPLLASAKAGFTETTLIRAGDTLGSFTLPWAGQVIAIAAKTLTAITWRGQTITPTITLQKLKASINKGTQIGTATYDKAGTVPLVTTQPIIKPSWHWRLTHAL